MSSAPDRLRARLDAAADAPRLLLACDFDGTLSDLVSDPDAAQPRKLVSRAIDSLASLPETLVAIVSGRSLDNLRAVTGRFLTSRDIRLFGSHGLEADDGATIGIPRATSQVRDDLVRQLRTIACAVPGARLESKPYGAAIHYRDLTASGAEQVTGAAREFLDQHPTLFSKPGKEVMEISVLPLFKPFAIDTLQHRWVPDVTIYAGDDETDEDVFVSLWPGDISIKVGDGGTAAEYRATDPETLEELLCRLDERRRMRTARPTAAVANGASGTGGMHTS